MLRLLHVVVLAALVLAAVDVYKIKYEATLQAERVAKLRAEVRREHEAVAALRAEWTQLDNPERLQLLARRHLPLKPADSIAISRSVRIVSSNCPSTVFISYTGMPASSSLTVFLTVSKIPADAA